MLTLIMIKRLMPDADNADNKDNEDMPKML